MAQQFNDTDEFRDARFWHVDLSGAVFRACDVNDVKIVGSDINNLRIDGHIGRAGTVIIDGVDVTAFVDAELDRRFPELVQLREMSSPDDFRRLWATTERLWDETIERARHLPPDALHEPVADEWSFIETLRHLVFATDVWIGRMIHGTDLPFSVLGLPPGHYSGDAARALGIASDAHPTLDEVIVVHGERRSQMTHELAGLSDTRLAETRTFAPEPIREVETVTVRDCLFTVIEEHLQHRRYAVRDLATLESR